MAVKEILRMEKIVKQYVMGEEVSTVLKGIDLTVNEGEFLAVLGPSGSGKSTLMNIIGCLDTPTSGDYYLSGRLFSTRMKKHWRISEAKRLDLFSSPFIFCSVRVPLTM